MSRPSLLARRTLSAGAIALAFSAVPVGAAQAQAAAVTPTPAPTTPRSDAPVLQPQPAPVGSPEARTLRFIAPSAYADATPLRRWEILGAGGILVGILDEPDASYEPRERTIDYTTSVPGPYVLTGLHVSGARTAAATLPEPTPGTGPDRGSAAISGLASQPGPEAESLTLSWRAAWNAAAPSGPRSYVVYDGGVRVGVATGESITLRDLRKSSFRFTVRSVVDPSGVDPFYGAPSALLDVGPGTPGGPGGGATRVDLAATGAISLKTLVRGSVPLTGVLIGEARGDVLEADVSFAAGQANVSAFGFLPLKVAVTLEPTSLLTGKLDGGQLKASMSARVRVPAVSLFGVRLAGGAGCASRTVSQIPLASTSGFTPAAGGVLSGTFSIASFTGCGFLTGLVSPLVAGSGNAIALTAAPRSR